jgi:hypothetical protein
MVAVADVRDTALTYAAGDVVGYVAALGVTPPVDADVVLNSPPWYCLGWIDSTGVAYKPTRSLKEVTAAGSLSSIRTVVTSEVKSLTAQFLEPMNPWVRALFDDVPIATVSPGRVDTGITLTASTTVTDANAKASDVGKTITATGGTGSIPAGTTIVSVTPGTSYVISAAATAGTPTSVVIGNGANKAAYIMPEVRQINQYAFVFDSFDGDKKVRMFGVRGQVNNPGDESLQQADSTNLTMEITFYPDNITLGGTTSRGTMARYLDDVAAATSVYIP